ncbi:SNF2 family N-terminal domain-containing protein [Mycena olivaceomarginata]|nr:SNF2 family N-terminal domain-containing protein [Mycena olivaceomarginata]
MVVGWVLFLLIPFPLAFLFGFAPRLCDIMLFILFDALLMRYIVVDEGHRLKNMYCALVRVIKRYNSAGRMVLTGTPLHNNLAELWPLLSFILPDIFKYVEAFQEWRVVFSHRPASLPHRVLSPHPSLPLIVAPLPHLPLVSTIPFPPLSRPLTPSQVLPPVHVRAPPLRPPLLPPKKSHMLYMRQREAYGAVLSSGVGAWVAGGAGASAAATSTLKASTSTAVEADAEMTLHGVHSAPSRASRRSTSSSRTTATCGRGTFHILANELVPGNIITFAMGERIPTDIRVVLTVDLEVDESSLSHLWSTRPLRTWALRTLGL